MSPTFVGTALARVLGDPVQLKTFMVIRVAAFSRWWHCPVIPNPVDFVVRHTSGAYVQLITKSLYHRSYTFTHLIMNSISHPHTQSIPYTATPNSTAHSITHSPTAFHFPIHPLLVPCNNPFSHFDPELNQTPIYSQPTQSFACPFNHPTSHALFQSPINSTTHAFTPSPHYSSTHLSINSNKVWTHYFLPLSVTHSFTNIN